MYEIPVNVQASGLSQNLFYSFPLNFPNYYIGDNGSGTGAMAAITAAGGNQPPDLYNILFGNSQEFIGGVAGAPYPPIFDCYKVQTLKATFFPSAFVADPSLAASPSIVNYCYHYNDLDDSSSIYTFPIRRFLDSGARPISYNNMKGSITFVYKQLRDNKNKWLNSTLIQRNSATAPPMVPGNSSTYGSTTWPNVLGGMKILFTGVFDNAMGGTSIGRIIVEWDIILRGVASLL